MARLLIIFSILILSVSAVFADESPSVSVPPLYKLAISFDIPSSRLFGTAEVPVRSGEKVYFNVGSLVVRDVRLNGSALLFQSRDGVLEALSPESGSLEIRYEGSFPEISANSWIDKDHIGKRGISLTGVWYPRVSGLFCYKLSAVLPKGYEAISEAESVIKEEKGNETEISFDFPHPVNGINFVAADRYEITKDEYKGIEVLAYFFPEDKGLARQYIDYAKRYLQLYEGLLGSYPYKRFSIVENFLPTGYSMPTFTLLGQDVVKLPFIVETSLGHEILHQWFGNKVYVDYSRGNWAEGLTSYLADHLYEEQKGRGWEYRKQSLVDFTSYVTEGNDFPLRDFKGRIDQASKVIGYGKATMVFHMLKEMVGEKLFFSTLRGFVDEKGFRTASWDDLRVAFEKSSQRDLASFFSQWLDQKGLPSIFMEVKAFRQTGKGFEITFDITEKGAYVLDLPLTFTFSQGKTRKETLMIKEGKNSFTFTLDEMPLGISLDENYDIARVLAPKEVPPVVSGLLGEEPIVVALPVSNKDAYGPVIEFFKARKAAFKEPGEIGNGDIKSTSLIILGGGNPLLERLFGKGSSEAEGLSVVMKRNPWNVRKVVGIISASSAEEALAGMRKFPRYGKYSSLSFVKGTNVSKTIADSDRGMTMQVEGEPSAIETSRIKGLSDVIGAVSDKRIVYVGESHESFSHHYVQLKVIKGLFEKNKKIAIGMEMFQRPFQSLLDDYISGKLDEKSFIKKTEYFTRWGYDYNLYKPIIDFARQNGIPIIALNTTKELVEKVARGGIDGLSAEERKQIPPQMDFSDLDYKERLKEIFGRHMRAAEKDFDLFFQSQVLWDETMSFSVDEYLKAHPDTQVVVLAGSGHLSQGSGIPNRTFRRNGESYSIILSDGDVAREVADYIVFPTPVEGVTSPKMMVLLKKEEGRVVISGFPEKSIAQQAGLEEEDVILALDNVPVADIEDIRLHLLSKKKGDTVVVKVLRKRFLFGDTEKDITVTFPLQDPEKRHF
ncbi:MAG: PDZ domain-containing protein [Nitrospirales bacterium]|nr:PDZ domain-containing protein [Nitrospirales bacterium]